jgi:hypothetical protein
MMQLRARSAFDETRFFRSLADEMHWRRAVRGQEQQSCSAITIEAKTSLA